MYVIVPALDARVGAIQESQGPMLLEVMDGNALLQLRSGGYKLAQPIQRIP
jgi:hypothetical protein